MSERKRFQNQTLDSKDYEGTEEKAQAVKNGGKIAAAVVLTVGVVKKYGPAFIKNISRLRRN